MKPVSLSTLGDRAKFKIATRRRGAIYRVNRKEGKEVIVTSVFSGRTFRKKGSLKVYPIAK